MSLTYNTKDFGTVPYIIFLDIDQLKMILEVLGSPHQEDLNSISNSKVGPSNPTVFIC